MYVLRARVYRFYYDALIVQECKRWPLAAVTVSKAAAVIPRTFAAAAAAPQLDPHAHTGLLSSTRWPATEPWEFCISAAVAGDLYDNRTSGSHGYAAHRLPCRPIACNRTGFPALRGQPKPTAVHWPQIWWPSASNTCRTRGTLTAGHLSRCGIRCPEADRTVVSRSLQYTDKL